MKHSRSPKAGMKHATDPAKTPPPPPPKGKGKIPPTPKKK